MYSTSSVDHLHQVLQSCWDYPTGCNVSATRFGLCGPLTGSWVW